MKRFTLIVSVLSLCLLAFACKPEGVEETKSKQIASAIKTENTSSNPYFLQISDVHLNVFATNITYGDDTGTQLWTNTKAQITSILQQQPAPEFVVYTGDLPAHYSCGKTCFIPPEQRNDHKQNIANILDDLRTLVAAQSIPLYYAPGNNDALAGDYYSFTDAQQQTPFSLSRDVSNPYPALNSEKLCGQAPCTVSEAHPRMGYYSAKPVDGLRIIALNSVILGRKYVPVDGISHLDAGNEQMQWLQGQLKDAATAGDKVYLIMHIPPGQDAYAVSHNSTDTWMWAHLPSIDNSWLNQFLAMVENHQQTIAGILYGHTHMDEMRRLYNPAGDQITEVAISAPGITPQHYNNPGFKAIWFHANNKELLDFKTYYTTPAAQSWGTDSYRFSTTFNCATNSTIYQCLTSKKLAEVDANMDKIFTVKHGAPGYATESGIEVKTGQ